MEQRDKNKTLMGSLAKKKVVRPVQPDNPWNMILPLEDKKTLEIFVAYLACSQNDPDFIHLYIIFEEYFYLFLSLFGGKRVKVPPVWSLKKILKNCEIYCFMHKGSFTSERYVEAANRFQVRAYIIKRIVDKVDSVLKQYSEKIEQWKKKKVKQSKR